MWVATADTMIACWEAKYHYYFWRPTHAIQRADTDGNPATAPDPTWVPLFVGNHPEYPSGHACMTAAVTQSLKGYFGTKQVPLEFTSNVDRHDAVVRSASTISSTAIEDARVWGGLHFRTTMTDTAKHFPRIARDVGREHFLADSGRRREGDRRLRSAGGRGRTHRPRPPTLGARPID